MASRHAQAAGFFKSVYAGDMMACGALQLTAHDGHTIVKFIAQSFDYGSFDVPAKITNSRIAFSSRLPNCKRRN